MLSGSGGPVLVSGVARQELLAEVQRAEKAGRRPRAPQSLLKKSSGSLSRLRPFCSVSGLPPNWHTGAAGTRKGVTARVTGCSCRADAPRRERRRTKIVRAMNPMACKVLSETWLDLTFEDCCSSLGYQPASGIGPAACSTARSATTCVASRRVAAAYGVAHLALRTPFSVQNHDARSAWEHWSTGVVLFRSRATQLRGVERTGNTVFTCRDPLHSPAAVDR